MQQNLHSVCSTVTVTDILMSQTFPFYVWRSGSWDYHSTTVGFCCKVNVIGKFLIVCRRQERRRSWKWSYKWLPFYKTLLKRWLWPARTQRKLRASKSLLTSSKGWVTMWLQSPLPNLRISLDVKSVFHSYLYFFFLVNVTDQNQWGTSIHRRDPQVLQTVWGWADSR